MERYIVCYDVQDKRCLQRIHRAIRKAGAPLQYSVFCVECDERRIDGLMNALAKLINSREDDLRAYRIPARGLVAHIGQPAMPDGILWSGYPIAPAESPIRKTS